MRALAGRPAHDDLGAEREHHRGQVAVRVRVRERAADRAAVPHHLVADRRGGLGEHAARAPPRQATSPRRGGASSRRSRASPPSTRMPEQPGDARDVDERLGLGEPQLERGDQAVPAGERQRRLRASSASASSTRARPLVVERLGDHAPPPFCIASQTRAGCSGISRCLMPRWLSASTAALTTAAVAAIVPASPMPLTPSGFVGDGVTVRAEVEVRHLGGARDHVVDERAGQDLPVVVVDRLLVQRLRDRLRDAAVHLALDDHRVDDVAAVVDRGVALDRDLAGLAVDLDLGDVRAEREREVRRVEERRRLEVRLHALGQRVRRPGRARRAPGSSSRARASP